MIARVGSVLLAVLFACSTASARRGVDAPERLEAGKTVTRDVRGKQADSFAVVLATGQVLDAAVDQLGIDVKVTVVAPDGATVYSMDNVCAARGVESVAYVADRSGEFRVVVQNDDAGAVPARYTIRVLAIREATDADRARMEGLSTFAHAVDLWNANDFAEFVPVAKRAVETLRRAHGGDDPEVAAAISLYGVALEWAAHDEKGAEAAIADALAMYERTIGANDYRAIDALDAYAVFCLRHRDFVGDEKYLRRSIALAESLFGPNDNALDALYQRLSTALLKQGRVEEGEASLEHALAIREAVRGHDHVEVAKLAFALAKVYAQDGHPAKAEAALLRSIAIREKVNGPDDRDIWSAKNDLAYILELRGRYADAEDLLQSVVAADDRNYGPDSKESTTAIGNLAELYRIRGLYARAESLESRVLETRERKDGPESIAVADSLQLLGSLYLDRGQYEKSEALLARCVAIRSKVFAPDDSTLVPSLSMIGEAYRRRQNFETALEYYRRALAIAVKRYGEAHREVIGLRSAMGAIDLANRKFADAKARFASVVATAETAQGVDGTQLITCIANLAAANQDLGDFAEAERLYQRALAQSEALVGPHHPLTGRILANYASLGMAQGDAAKAVAHMRRSSEGRERDLLLNGAAGSERAKSDLLSSLSDDVDESIQLQTVVAPRDQEALRLAIEMVLRRKGRALDLMSDAVERLRRGATPDDLRLLDDLADARERLARMTRAGAGSLGPEKFRAAIADLSGRVEALESQVGDRSARFRTESAPVTLADVRAAIPEGAALVEYIVHTPFDPRAIATPRTAPKRYVAYVVFRDAEPKWVDLGEAAPVDALVAKARDAMRNPARRDVKQIARALDEAVMRPIRALVGSRRRLLVSPDGDLNLLPFAALVDERGRYLVSTYEISYLTSGRDLLRFAAHGVSRQVATVVADPNFGEASTAAPASVRDIVQANGVAFLPLPGTELEARSLELLLPGSVVLTKDEATETALKKVAAPRLLHVATHGFFLGDSGSSRDSLLRSGLALAGANSGNAGGEDGILTALEVAGLDLWGTKLVVLSACNTGVGEVRAGDGVYGLRRALVLAGSESQVMSLWSIDDDVTRRLMVAYYRNLIAGRGRAEALRRVQMELLGASRTSHPFYWAGFIESGQWEPLDRER